MIIEKYSDIRPDIPLDKKMANLLQENRYGQLDLNKSIENIIHFIWVRRPIPELYTKGLKSYAKKCETKGELLQQWTMSVLSHKYFCFEYEPEHNLTNKYSE